jgi:hypothetical protein
VQDKLEVATRILHVGQLCHKLMREGERIQPFCSPHQALYPDLAPSAQLSVAASVQVAPWTPHSWLDYSPMILIGIG